MGNEDQSTARLQNLCESRLLKRYPRPLHFIATERLRRELQIVDRLGRARNFLAAEEFFRYARDEGFACRLFGSSCSTFIGYCLPQVDPGFVNDIAAMFAAQIMDIDDLCPGTMEKFLSDGQNGDFAGEKWQSVRMSLADSRGLVLYQEQIMTLLNHFGGIELWDGYVFCKGLAKKKQGAIDEYRERFLPQATAELGEGEARFLFQRIVEAAPFVRCKSQVMADAMTCFQAAYMKVHYREEFEAVLRTVQAEN